VREHIRLGMRAAVIEAGVNGEQIGICDNGAQIPLIWTHLIPRGRREPSGCRSTRKRGSCGRAPRRWAPIRS